MSGVIDHPGRTVTPDPGVLQHFVAAWNGRQPLTGIEGLRAAPSWVNLSRAI